MMGGIFSPYLLAPLCAWLLAQLLKLILGRGQPRKIDLQRLYLSGGMPSAHTAVVVSLATATGLTQGLGSVEFGIALILALIVIYDAMNVRYIVGEQGTLITKLLTNHPDLKGVKAPKIIRGHTLGEVFGGVVLGVLVACLILFAQNP